MELKIIKSQTQYYQYCNLLEQLAGPSKRSRSVNNKIELLELLISHYDDQHNIFRELDPVRLLKSLMKDHGIRAVQLAIMLNVSEGLVSDMLNYKKGFSKESIRILSSKFSLRQEAFNRPYALKTIPKAKPRPPRRKVGHKVIKGS